MKKQPLINNIWVMRGVSLIFSLILFVAVRASTTSQVQNQTYTSVASTETIANVPLHLGEHDEDVFISNVPETVMVTLEGPKNIIAQLTTENFQVTTEDFKNRHTGQTTLRLTAKGLPDNVNYKVTPSQINVTLSRKKTVTLPVEYEIAADAIADNYQVSEVILNPAEVTLTGTEATINKIDKVFVRVTTNQPRSRSFTEKYKLQIIDASGKLLDINASTNIITTTVNIAANSKEVDLTIVPTGEQEQFDYQYAFPDTNKVILQAPSDVLNAVQNVAVRVDVSQLTTPATVTGYLMLPEQVTSVTLKEVPVQVTVAPRSEEGTLSEESSRDSSVESSVETGTSDESVGETERE